MMYHMVNSEVALKAPTRPDGRDVLTALIATALSIVLVFAFSRYSQHLSYVPAPAISSLDRDAWYRETPAVVIPDAIKGLATWYDAKQNGAWYTRKTTHGNTVKFYAAAGPKLRQWIELILGKDIRWGITTWQKWADAKSRPKFLLTSKLTGKSVVIVVTDWCGCDGRANDPNDTRLIDLSPDIWNALGVPLGLGVMKVTLERIDGGKK